MNNFIGRCFAWLPSLRTAFAIGVILLVVGLPLGIYHVYTTVIEEVHDCYTELWVALSIIEHLKTHDDAWPESWEELLPSYKRLTERAGYKVWSVDELQRRVEVDWYADVERLRKFANTGVGPSPRIIRLRDGREVHWSGQEPNEMVLKYLRLPSTENNMQPLPAAIPDQAAIQNAGRSH